MLRSITLPFAVLLATVAMAQAPHRSGCHYFRNNVPEPHVLTSAERALIDDVIARSDTFDILHYDIALDVTDYTNQTLRAATTITYTPLMAGQTFIRFDLFELVVDSVTDANGPLNWEYDDPFLRVDLPVVAQVGSTYDLTVHYHGQPHRDPEWGGFYFESGYIYNLGIGLSTIPPNFGKVWYPCFDSFVERATYTYHVKSSGTYRAHCQGDFLGEVALGGDTVIRSFDLAQPIPTHLSAVAVAAYQDSSWVHTGANGPIPVTLTAKSNQLNGMVTKFVDIGNCVDALEYWYGPYAWSRVGYVLTTDGALEIPTNIAYPDFMTSQNAEANRDLYGHELGHHWWGDMVTPRTHNDMWIKEGPAEYSGHLFHEWLYGDAAFDDKVKDNQQYVLEQAHLQDGGFQPLSPMPDPYIYGLHTYYKGASVMHNLRGYLGDALFRQAMAGVQADNAYTTLDATQFKNALEAQTGYDLDPFFAAQVFAPGFAAFVVENWSAQPNGGNWDVDLDLRQKLRGTTTWHEQVPLDVTLVGADWQRQEYQVIAGGEFSSAALTCAFQPVMVILNGSNRLNQARLDHEFVNRVGQNFTSLLPHTEFRLYPVTVADSALMRVEHIWSGPDVDNADPLLAQISSSHYWIVDGIWPADNAYYGKLYYNGINSNELDFDLYGVDEVDAVVAYRETPGDPWVICPDLVISANDLYNGLGNFTVNNLRKGQYAFAKAIPFASIDEETASSGSLHLYPVPAQATLAVKGEVAATTVAVFDILSADGKLKQRNTATVQSHFERSLDVSALTPGAYVLRITDAKGALVGVERFEVVR